MTDIIMYDSVTASDIPRNARAVAGYLNGIFKWSNADWALFPNAFHVGIATRADVDGDVLDVESGAATAEQAPAWAVRQRRRGVDPVVYCSESVWAAVRRAFALAGVPEPKWWIAHYDGVAQLIPGAVGKQYINSPNSGGHYDKSIVATTWPGLEKYMSDISGTADFALNYVAVHSEEVFGHHAHAGDWLQDMRLQISALQTAVTDLTTLVKSLSALHGSGAISGSFTIGE